MITNNPSGKNPVNQPKEPKTTVSIPTQKKASSQTFIAIASVAGLILLGVIAFLGYNNVNKNRALATKVTELEEAEQLRIELEDQYHAALSELEDLRGTNEELNSLIDQQKVELKEQKNKVARLIRNKKKLGNARAELDNMKAQLAEYVAQIEQLKTENEQLAQQNQQLSQDKELLETDLQSKITENQELDQARAVLVSEKEKMAKTLHLASVVSVKNVEVTGLKLRSGGKTAKRNTAKSIDQLKVCFTTTVNQVAHPGLETFHIRIIDPRGETLAIDELGSGVIINAKTGEEIRFTQLKEYDYENDETQLCFLWEPNTTFQKGKYDVEIYNKGYLAGTGKFSLK